MRRLDPQERILAFLQGQEHPTGVEKIRKAAGIGHWNAALAHLLQLCINRKICGQKTSNGWTFWAKPLRFTPTKYSPSRKTVTYPRSAAKETLCSVN